MVLPGNNPNPPTDPSGILLVDKPKGWTSHDVVAKLRGITGIKKIGHGGTLDPMATGLLVIGIGSATKKLEQFVQGDKTYLAGVTLGATSTTDDEEGELTERPVVSEPNEEMVVPMLQKFVGTQEQLPPVYSAIKTDGKKAYAEARAGRDVERKPRLVTIHELETVGYQYPRLMIRVTVSKGTYIRALARDIGEALGTGGYLSALRRERVGAYALEQAHRLSELEHGWERFLLS
jgi:tRNA pseudouridine55 synthase